MTPAEEDTDADKREALLSDIFAVLDQKRRGFISRVELAHILDAMQADASVKFTMPEGLTPSIGMRDARVSLGDLRRHLALLHVSDLEDVKWWAESVVRVESELKEVWRTAVQRWRERVECLYQRNLHRYLLASQPERISRWLLLRTTMDEVNKDDSSIGLLGLGISQQEVEVLFTDETADDINKCSEKIEPFLAALDLRSRLGEVCLEGAVTERCPEAPDARAVEIFTKLVDVAERCRELACLLIHEDTLSFAAAVVRTDAFSQAVVTEASKLIMALISYRVHENARDYEKVCRQTVSDFLEMDFQVETFDLEMERLRLNGPVSKPGRLSLHERAEPRENVSEWIGSLLTLRADFNRGEMLDVLIKYDERRLLLEGEGGERIDESEPVAVSLFSYGRSVPHILSRLDVSSHHTLHEHRTPMRTHLWKLLLNVVSSAGDLGRKLFRAGDGMRVVCIVMKGSAWGVEREEVTAEEEEDREEEEELYHMGQGAWGLKDPYHSWPYVEDSHVDSHVIGAEHRFYNMDFLDDKFYGSKDRMLAAAFLEYMAMEGMWGEDALVEEMMQYPNTLQTLSRVRPPGCFLMRLLLSSPRFPAYMQSVAANIARACTERSLQQLLEPDATCHSLFPVCYDLDGQGHEALAAFRRQIMEVQRKNVVLRILAHAYHVLQASLQDERSMREGDASRSERRTGDPSEPIDEATQLEGEIAECCKLLAHQLPITMEEAGNVCVAIYMQVKDFTRKALLAMNQLPPVNPDDRQRARGLEVAKTVPPRPMYFGHYQQLIYNQSNPTQPSSRALVFEYQARLKCLQGTADILFTGENRYLSEPSLFPYEFLVVLRLVQLLRLREQSVPPFVAELQDLLEQLTGQRSSSVFSDAREDPDLAGAEYPWRTGLAQLNSFRVSQVPVRRSELRRLPRGCPLDIVRGLEATLREYCALNMWEEEKGEQSTHVTKRSTKDGQRLEALAARRSVLLALVLNHLCYFQPKTVTLEDSPQGLLLRLGLSLEMLSAAWQLLSQPCLASLRGGRDFAAALLPPNGNASNGCQFNWGTRTGAVGILQVTTAAGSMAFVCMNDTWVLWANCTKDSAEVLTTCSSVQRYFNFDMDALSADASRD